MRPISAIIITRNEEDRIRETISSLGFCDEVIVVDSGSSDQTRREAAATGARVFDREWSGFSDQKNHAAGLARYDWVLSIDADERPSASLAGEIVRWKSSDPGTGEVAMSMPRRVRYLGRWIAHSGWYPDRKIRLYDRRFACWEGDFVHESLAVDGPVGRFAGDLLHFPYRSLAEHYRTVDRYTRLASDELRKRGRRFNPARLVLGPILYFLKSFLLRGGFLDGTRGVLIAYMGARYVFLRELRLLR
jgi:glycosyltransferase involved in cell wall biosynthesis